MSTVLVHNTQLQELINNYGGTAYAETVDKLFVAPASTTDGLPFGAAVAAAKEGKRIAREGWNGNGMFVFQRPADTLPADFLPNMKSLPESVKEFLVNRATTWAAEQGIPLEEVVVPVRAYLCLFAADGSIVIGWAPSQTDMQLADWHILD